MANNWSSVADGLVLLEECAIVTHLQLVNPACFVFGLMTPFT